MGGGLWKVFGWLGMENRSPSNIGIALSTELHTKPAEMSDHIKAYYLWHIIKHFIESFSWYLASLPGGLYCYLVHT